MRSFKPAQDNSTSTTMGIGVAESEYDRELTQFLFALACTDKYMAQGVALADMLFLYYQGEDFKIKYVIVHH